MFSSNTMYKPPTNVVSVKVSFEEDLRRFNLPVEAGFQQLISTVRGLYERSLNPSMIENLVLKYKDDEGDMITITSDDELKEAISLSKNQNPPILRLTITVVAPAHPHPHPSRRADHPCRRPHWRCRVPPSTVPASLPPTRKSDKHEHELVLTPMPYGHGNYICDVCSVGGRGASYHCVQCSFDLHPSCEDVANFMPIWARRQLWFRLNQNALEKLSQNTPASLDEARRILKQQLALSVEHSSHPLYNLACCEALAGNRGIACDYLAQAVQAGFTDVEHIKRDSDLDNIRDEDHYQAIVLSLSAPDEQVDVAVQVPVQTASVPPLTPILALTPLVPATSAPVASPAPVTAPAPVLAPAPPVPQAATVPSVPSVPQPAAPSTIFPPAPLPQISASQVSGVSDFEDKLRTLSEMGWVDRRKNILVLVSSKGDLVEAVQKLLAEAN